VCKQKGNSFCTELGPEVASWSRRAPLEKPKWIGDSLKYLNLAMKQAEERKIDEARQTLKNSPDAKLREWFNEHGQNSGTWRFKALGYCDAKVVGPLDPNKYLSKFERFLYERDNYRCRYCDSEVIPKKVFKALQGLLGEEALPLKGTNAGRSGYYLMFCATLDHVIPHSLGGPTIEANLVTCCWSCNYGKSDYTLEQLGLDNLLARNLSSESKRYDSVHAL